MTTNTGHFVSSHRTLATAQEKARGLQNGEALDWHHSRELPAHKYSGDEWWQAIDANGDLWMVEEHEVLP